MHDDIVLVCELKRSGRRVDADLQVALDGRPYIGYNPGAERVSIAALIALGAVPTQELQAASCTWNPATGNWANAGNWSCGIVPTGPANDSATIGAAKTVTIDSAQSIFTLINAGTINIDAFLLTLQAGGSTANSGTINIGGPSTASLQMLSSILLSLPP